MTETAPSQSRAAGVREMYTLLARFHAGWHQYVLCGAAAAVSSLCEAGTLIMITLSAAGLAGGDAAPKSFLGQDLGQGQLLTLAAVFLVARLVSNWMFARLISRLAAGCLVEARRQVLDAYLTAGWDRQSREEQGVVYDLLANRAEVVGYSASIVCSIIAASINLAVLACAALVLQPLAVLALGVVGAAISFVLRPLNKRTRNLSRRYLDQNLVFVNSLTDLTLNARDITSYGVGSRFLDRVMRQQQVAAELYRRRNVLTQFGPQVYQSIGLGLAVVGLAVASWAGGSDIATLGAVVLLLLRSTSYGQVLMTSVQAINERVPYVGSTTDMLDDFASSYQEPGTDVPDEPIDLVLDSVEYRYRDEVVLDGVSIRIAPGERLGIVGPSGGGKSTLLQVLAGLRMPAAGAYRVGGVSITDLDMTWWRQQMAIVSQDSHLLTETVALNIDFLRGLRPEELRRAAADAQLADEIEALGGYDVQISREGRALSGGQAQRLAIARALAGDPTVLLLDEPTSALDVVTESRLQAVLADVHGRTTMVIVAHRLATVSACDRIIVLDAGRVIADGPPDSVLQRFDADSVSKWDLVRPPSPPATSR